MIYVAANFGSLETKYPQIKKIADSKSKIPVLSCIVYTLQQDKTMICLDYDLIYFNAYDKQSSTIQAFWTY